MTEFQNKVYEALKLIPRGKVTTYKQLGDFIKCGSSQAVGQALKKNPFAPEVPCHRVIKSDLTIGGYIGEREGELIEKKISLLRNEGIQISADGKLLNSKQLFKYKSTSV